MSIESAWLAREQKRAMRERYPGFQDVVLDHRTNRMVAFAWNGCVGGRSLEDAGLDSAASLLAFFDEKLSELHFELAPEAL